MGKKISKEEVIQALLELSFIYSTGATSLGDIATRLGIKKASLYNHFESREDLISKTNLYCAGYLRAMTFSPSNLTELAEKYSASAVLKGTVNRYFKMFQKNPLFEIYTFVQSQKYFSKEAMEIVRENDTKLAKQTLTILQTLIQKEKLPKMEKQRLQYSVLWFCSGINDLLNRFLMERKQTVMQTPAEGVGQLFNLPANLDQLKKIDLLVDYFINLIVTDSLPRSE